MKIIFLIVVFSSLTFGLALSLPIVCLILKQKKFIFKFFISLIPAFLIGSFITFLIIKNSIREEKIWNNGYCFECGKPWHFANANVYKSQTSYFWVCDDCNVIIELYSNYKK